MIEGNKMLYIVVVDNNDHSNENDDDDNDNSKSKTSKTERGQFGNDSVFCYTRSVLQNTLQFVGCKARHAFEISKRVFETVKSHSSSEAATRVGRFVADTSNIGPKVQDLLSNGNKLSSELYKRRTTVFINRTKFLDVVCDALAEYKYVGPKQREDFILACRIRERRESVIILLCGTSGCGKSTLSSLLGSRLGITTIVSTDSIRHLMRSFVDEKDNPLLWASTYHAGECLDPIAVSQAEERKKARKKARLFTKDILLPESVLNEKSQDSHNQEGVSNNAEPVGPRRMAIEGFKAQSEMVIESLDRLITAWEKRKDSVIVEGVHLSLNFVMGLMTKHPSIIPFMIYIPEEEKHVERFAVRAKYMTLDPSKNKYVKYIKNIRRIQEYLSYRADKHRVPKINNTNVDKSVTAIHATLFSCLRRREAGEQLYNPATNTVNAIYEEYRNHSASNSFTSKGMFQLIQKNGSSRNFMAFVNNDGSVSKAWPIDCVDRNGKSILETFKPGSAEGVNLQFGHLGISGWPREPGSTSSAGSVDDLRSYFTGTENGSMCYSSCCSSPRKGDCLTKKIKENQAVSDSDEEVNDHPEVDSDDDLSDGGRYNHEEIEGSVDEESTKSDEEYDDLAMQYALQSGYWSEDEAEIKDKLFRIPKDHFEKIEKTKTKRSHSRNPRTRTRSLSIPNFDKHGVAIDPWLKITNNLSPVIQMRSNLSPMF